MGEAELLEKLRKIEALHAERRATEREAARAVAVSKLDSRKRGSTSRTS